MRSLVGGFALVLLAIANTGWGAEEGPAQAGKCVSIEVVLADVLGTMPAAAPDPGASAEITPQRIEELEKQGQLEALTRIRLSTLEHCPATVQFGERVPVATSRAIAFRSRDGSAPATTSYDMVSVGTIVELRTRVEEDGAILLDLQVERSRLAARETGTDKKNAEASDFVPQRIVTVTAKSNVRIPAGKTVITEAQQTLGKESRRTWILVTAEILDTK